MSAPPPDEPSGGTAGPATEPRGAPVSDPGYLSNRYELGELLGRGGMADVRIGVDRRLGRRVAVKQLRSDLSRDPTIQARFRREAQSAASLNHPSIVAVYDTGEHADATGSVVPYIVMEHAEGETLRDILRSGRKVLPHRALEMTAQVLSALDYSHHAGIVHRDIKPANVMLTPSGRAKVMDFGIARSVSDASVTMTQAVVGTAQYLSPEQARGEPADARSDLYSTGCLLFELLTGRPPFQGDTPVAVAYQHVREEPPAPSRFNPEVTPAMDAIVGRALAKKTSDRYQSAAQMRADIERALSGRQVASPVATPAATADAGSPSTTATLMAPVAGASAAGGTGSVAPLPRPTKRPRRRRRIWLLALLGLALAVGAALLVPWLLDDTPPADASVPELLGQTLPEAQLALDREGLVSEVKRRESDEPVGTVVEQDPDPDTMVVADSTVTLVVSGGPAQVQVPYILGEPRREAISALNEAELDAEVTFEDSDQPQGTVLDTNPDPTMMVDPGSTVVLVVSAGPVTVPAVRGLSESSAVAALQEAGFGLPEVVEDQGSDQPAGVVVDQTPEPGTKVISGSIVILTVSARPEPTAAPTTAVPTPEPTPTPTPTPEPTPTPTPEPEPTPTQTPTQTPTKQPTSPPTIDPTPSPR